MKITGLYIAKNEEKNILKSIDSIEQACDEIIVVDTGSTDKTIELLQSRNIKVINYTWEQDFAKARNFAIQQATGDIIIFLDCDEYFSPFLTIEDKNTIINSFGENEIDLISIATVNIDIESKQELFENYAHKIFKKQKDIYYVNPIHETLHKKEGQLCCVAVNTLKIIHTGYCDSSNFSKSERNLAILNEIKNPTPMELFYLIRENLNIGKYDKAEEYISLLDNHPNKLDIVHNSNIGFLFYLYKNMVLNRKDVANKHELIIKNLNELQELIPNFPEVYYNYGAEYFKSDYTKAEEYLLKAIQLNANANDIYDTKVNNYKAYEPTIYSMLSEINFYKHNKTAAINNAMVAYMLQRKNKKYLGDILRLMDRRQSDKNIEVLQHICNINNEDNLHDLVLMLSYTNLRNEFCTFANIYNNKFNGHTLRILYALMLTGHIKDAFDVAINLTDENKNLFIAIGLLYSNSTVLYDEYYDCLDEDYKSAVDYFINKNSTSKKYEVVMILKSIVEQLYIMGVEIFPTIVASTLCEELSSEDFDSLINIFYINGDYKKVIKYIEEYIDSSKELNDLLIKKLSLSCFITKKYDSFKKYYTKGISNVLDNVYKLYEKEVQS